MASLMEEFREDCSRLGYNCCYGVMELRRDKATVNRYATNVKERLEKTREKIRDEQVSNDVLV